MPFNNIKKKLQTIDGQYFKANVYKVEFIMMFEKKNTSLI